MVSIKWCKKKIILIKVNENLSKEYMKSAQETLNILRMIGKRSKMWAATTKYYAEYFAVYSLFMRLGIKSEIHECTIEICKLLESQNMLPKGHSKRLEEDKQLRIDNQYYLQNKDVEIDYDQILDFILKIKDKRPTLNQINKIRKIISHDI